MTLNGDLKMRILTSLQRDYRGFTFQKNYLTKEKFNDDMVTDRNKKSEICWALLFTDDGEKVAEYKRGYESAEYNKEI